MFFIRLPGSLLNGGLGMKNKSKACLCALLMWGSASFAQDHIEAYGDSITAGFLSHTNVTAAPPLSDLSKIITHLANFLMDKERNRSEIEKEHAPSLAWPAVLSRKIDPAGPVPLYNYAVSGANSWEMLDQVKLNNKTKGMTRAFFFVGHNDLCNNLDTPKNIGATFSYYVEKSLAEWDATHQGSIAYLVPVSDIHRVFETLDNYVWYRGTKRSYSCVHSWTKFFPYCPSHHKKFEEGTLERYMVPRLAAMNEALDALARTWTAKSKSNEFVYLPDVHDTDYEKEFFAIDCFHLSAEGQERVADRILDLVADHESL